MYLTPAQKKMIVQALGFAKDHPEMSSHGNLVSGHQYRTALALENKRLGSVRYQGPSLGWFVPNTESQVAKDLVASMG